MKTRYAVALAIVSAIAGAGLVQILPAQGKPKACTIAEIDVTDTAKFKPFNDGIATLVLQAGGALYCGRRQDICHWWNAAESRHQHGGMEQF